MKKILLTLVCVASLFGAKAADEWSSSGLRILYSSSRFMGGTLDGMSFGYNRVWQLGNTPFAIDATFGADWSYQHTDVTHTNFLDLRVPVSVSYNIRTSNSFTLSPYAGLYAKLYLVGMKSNDESETSMSYFSKKDFPNPAQRFNGGWCVGVNATLWRHAVVGVGFNYDFARMMLGSRMTTWQVTLGYNF